MPGSRRSISRAPSRPSKQVRRRVTWTEIATLQRVSLPDCVDIEQHSDRIAKLQLQVNERSSRININKYSIDKMLLHSIDPLIASCVCVSVPREKYQCLCQANASRLALLYATPSFDYPLGLGSLS